MSFVDVAQDVAPMTRMKLVRRRFVPRAPEGKCAPHLHAPHRKPGR